MADHVTITCQRCKNEIAHVCSESLREAAVRLFKWRPTIGFPEAMKRRNPWIGRVKGGYDVDGSEIPFLCQVYQYALLGEEDGRSLIALVNDLLRAAGLDPFSLKEAAARELLAMKLAREDAERRRTWEDRHQTSGGGDLANHTSIPETLDRCLCRGRSSHEWSGVGCECQ